MRIHQWVKNLLLLVPVFMAHRFGSIFDIFIIFPAFFAFSFMASSIYIINDLVDIESDRANPYKKKRPLAEGQIFLPYAIGLSKALMLLSLSLGFFIHFYFFLILLFYFFSTFVYSFYFKNKLIIDVMCLSGLYTLRIFAGSVIFEVDTSDWLLAFSLFTFLSLALLKRFVELNNKKLEDNILAQGNHKIVGRGYMVKDLPIISIAGIAFGFFVCSSFEFIYTVG